MDILVSSNLERLIFHLLGNDAAKTKELMDALVTKGEYTLADADKDILDLFAAGFATEDETAAEIKRVYDEDKYIEDPHTAVASAVYEAYVQKTDHVLQKLLVLYAQTLFQSSSYLFQS